LIEKFKENHMKKILRRFVLLLLALLMLAVVAAFWMVYRVQPQRSGNVPLAQLQAPVTVRYDERGVPHIRAEHEADLYRALGYVHAQDRLFQMEMVRRLAQGELAEVLGPKLLDTDRLFRTLGIRAHAEVYAKKLDASSPSTQALTAYLDGVNQFQASHPPPLEFTLLGIPKRPFTTRDTVAVSGYLAYSFAAGFRTEPVLTQIRDQLGARYLQAFDLDWHPEGVTAPSGPAPTQTSRLHDADWQGLTRLARLSDEALTLAGVPRFEGSNAWALAGNRTASGKPLLAGDPHIAYSAPAVWYEAHLSMPGFELYGHHQALNPLALLGHNPRFGWSLTMFQNDDLDLIAEKVNPANANQVWHRGQWVDMSAREESIAVKGQPPVQLVLRRSPHGPVISDAFQPAMGTTPIAMWWALLETENPVLDAFYELNRADTLAKARAAASKIHAPGLNVVWANASGDIAWWAAAKLPQRPAGVNPTFILDGSATEADKPGFLPFSDNPQEENPARGYIVSANHQPQSRVPVPGYYNLADRAQRLVQRLDTANQRWDVKNSQAVQLEGGTGYGPRVLKELLPPLRAALAGADASERALLDQLAAWDGDYRLDGTAPTLFFQLLYEVAAAAMADELGEAQFKNLLRTRALDAALPRLIADDASPWWDKRGTPAVETRADTVKAAWQATLAHLRTTLGQEPATWTWGRAHTLTHNHPLGQQKPLDKLFSIGPLAAPAGRETPNNLSSPIGPAPWAVNSGPSTRRLIDFADPGKALGINPVGQSGVVFDRHYADQSGRFITGAYVPQHLSEADVAAHTRSTLTLAPAR
jgi:penicillin G amidase